MLFLLPVSNSTLVDAVDAVDAVNAVNAVNAVIVA
jgi:hypothetical protein